jgi:hypothetical protein
VLPLIATRRYLEGDRLADGPLGSGRPRDPKQNINPDYPPLIIIYCLLNSCPYARGGRHDSHCPVELALLVETLWLCLCQPPSGPWVALSTTTATCGCDFRLFETDQLDFPLQATPSCHRYLFSHFPFSLGLQILPCPYLRGGRQLTDCPLLLVRPSLPRLFFFSPTLAALFLAPPVHCIHCSASPVVCDVILFLLPREPAPLPPPTRLLQIDSIRRQDGLRTGPF